MAQEPLHRRPAPGKHSTTYSEHIQLSSEVCFDMVLKISQEHRSFQCSLLRVLDGAELPSEVICAFALSAFFESRRLPRMGSLDNSGQYPRACPHRRPKEITRN